MVKKVIRGWLPPEETIYDVYRKVSLKRERPSRSNKTAETSSDPWWGNLPREQREVNKKGLDSVRGVLGLPNKELEK